MVPFAVQEVREATWSDVNKLMEDCWDHSLSLDFEVERALVRKSQEFLHQEPGALLEDGVDNRVDESRVTLSVVFTHQNLVLDVEM